MTNLEDGSKALPGSSEANSNQKGSICCHWIRPAFLGEREKEKERENFFYQINIYFHAGARPKVRKYSRVELRSSWDRPEEEHGSVNEALMLAGTAFVVPGIQLGPHLVSEAW